MILFFRESPNMTIHFLIPMIIITMTVVFILVRMIIIMICNIDTKIPEGICINAIEDGSKMKFFTKVMGRREEQKWDCNSTARPR